MKTTFRAACAFALSAAALPLLVAADGTVERIRVHGTGLEGNLEGDSPDREVAVYLPPSYKTAAARRYPVLYFLHGFTDSVEKWVFSKQHWINLPGVIDKSLAEGASREMIVVMPDAFTRYQGSMYSNSATTGDWEDYVASELVRYVDAHYRTIARRSSRGLAGHSMGGYGALRIGMKNPAVFSSVYLLSPCCLTPPAFSGDASRYARAEAIRSFDEIANADFMTKAVLASAAAWSPNPQRPPLYIDLPSRDGQIQPAVLAKWAANAPLAMVDQYIANLRLLKAFAVDAGDKDEPIATSARTLDHTLSAYGIPHLFEIYEGTHLSRVPERIETKALPFFSKNLSFE